MVKYGRVAVILELMLMESADELIYGGGESWTNWCKLLQVADFSLFFLPVQQQPWTKRQ